MGQDEADTLAMARPPSKATELGGDPTKVERAGAAKSAFDRTHVGQKGAELFARMVAGEFVRAVPAVKPYLKDTEK
jgi:hypothetical protein